MNRSSPSKSNFIFRKVDLVSAGSETEPLSFPVVVSTTFPTLRSGYGGDYWEVLSHRSGDIDLSRSPLPLLLSHNSDGLPVGVVDSLRVDGDKLRGRATFSASDQGKELARQVREGILRSLSAGYLAFDPEHIGESEGLPIYQFRWAPHEVSIVAIPADPKSGFNRGFNMSEFQNSGQDDGGEGLSRSQRRRMAQDDIGAAAERKRVSTIHAIAAQFTDYGADATVADAINSGTSVEQYRSMIMDLVSRAPKPKADIGLPSYGSRSYGARQYSISNLFASAVPGSRADAGYEHEVSQELHRQLGVPGRGLLVPLSALSSRAFSKGDGSGGLGGGGALVPTDLSSDLVDVFRPYAPMLEWVKVMTGLQGDVSIPRKTASAAMTWVEGDGRDSLSASDPAFDLISMSPKTVGAYTTVSHRMLNQNADAERLVRDDLAAAVGQEIARAIVAGTGASNQPKGILSHSGIGSAHWALGGAPDYSTMVSLEAELANLGALNGRLAYLTTPALAVALKQKDRGTDTGAYVWEAGRDASQPQQGLVNGYDAAMTSHMPAGRILFGNWQEVVLGMWGAISLEINPYGKTDWERGSVSVRVMADIDIALRTPGSMAVATESAT